MKNNKGFFLAEAIIMIALVTTVMAFVYPNVSKLYENYELQSKYFDQTEDLYNLRAIYYANKVLIDSKTEGVGPEGGTCSYEPGGKRFNSVSSFDLSSYALSDDNAIKFTTANISELNATISSEPFYDIYNGEIELYLTSYMSEMIYSGDPVFNKYLSRLKKTINDPSSYRLIAKFPVSNAEYHYASIKIENPNPNRVCNR